MPRIWSIGDLAYLSLPLLGIAVATYEAPSAWQSACAAEALTCGLMDKCLTTALCWAAVTGSGFAILFGVCFLHSILAWLLGDRVVPLHTRLWAAVCDACGIVTLARVARNLPKKTGTD